MNFGKLNQHFNLSIRLYHRSKKNIRFNQPKIPNPGVQNKVQLLKQNTEINDLDNDIMDPDDYSEFESDFMQAGEVHKMHEKEVRSARQKLQFKITRRKFLETEKEFSFLTFTEKIEIQNLHKNDPNYWTLERLSESFPALPKTIKKVIRAKWLPQSVEKVQKYDQKVIENWNKYRAGEIPVDSFMERHLEKFKDRKIMPADENYIKTHILEPIVEFYKPKSTTFLNIAEKFVKPMAIDNQETAQSIKLISSGKSEIDKKSDTKSTTVNKSTMKKKSESQTIICENKNVNNNLKYNEHKSMKSQTNNQIKKVNNKEPQTFYEFIKTNIETKKSKTTPDVMLMEDILKKENSKISEKYYNDLMIDSSVTENTLTTEITNKDELYDYDIEEKPKDKTESNLSKAENSALATYVKNWIKINDDDHDYPMCIKIPKSRFKSGMTYRFKDCYYDDDGKFLYRLPGIRS